jgi:hypothetical protein
MLNPMQNKKRRKEPSQTILSSVQKEMAKPRRAESSRKEADTLANGGHIAMVKLSHEDARSWPAVTHSQGSKVDSI